MHYVSVFKGFVLREENMILNILYEYDQHKKAMLTNDSIIMLLNTPQRRL